MFNYTENQTGMSSDFTYSDFPSRQQVNRDAFRNISLFVVFFRCFLVKAFPLLKLYDSFNENCFVICISVQNLPFGLQVKTLLQDQ